VSEMDARRNKQRRSRRSVPPKDAVTRPSTVEFCHSWHQRTQPANLKLSHPKWRTFHAEELECLMQEKAAGERHVASQRKWLSETFRRLKSDGRSDGRCREVVALHLPRGTGPVDVDNVRTFSQSEVKSCRREYTAEVETPQKQIRIAMKDMTKQRRALSEAKLAYQRTVEPLGQTFRHRLIGDGRVLLPDPHNATADGRQERSFAMLAAEWDIEGADEDVVAEVFSAFIKYADKSTETLSFKKLPDLMGDLCPSRTLATFDLNAFWAQALDGKASQVHGPGASNFLGKTASFEQIAACFFRSEFFNAKDFVFDDLDEL